MSELHCPNCGHHIGTLRRRQEAPRARSSYMEAAVEQLRDFLQERTVAAPGERVESAVLRREFEAWGGRVVSAKGFGQALRECGVVPYRSSGARYYLDIAVAG